MEPVRVLIADDHALVRRGIIAVLAGSDDLQVVGEAVDGLEAIEKARELSPDVIVMDLNMPRCSGLEAIQALQTEMPQVCVLVLTVSEMESDLFAAMKFGATGYLLKQVEPEDLIHAILYIAQGGVIVSPKMAAALLGEFKNPAAAAGEEMASDDADLSPREGEVLQLVAKGATNKEIAESLFISENTVKTHMQSIMEKLHLANRSQAAAYAVGKGLVKNKKE
ncbi:MAG: response regulator transcription factor [Chloroflexota bacterium]